MEIGNLKSTTTAYQGSGPKDGTSLKITKENRELNAVQAANGAGSDSQKQEPEITPIEVTKASKKESVKRAVEQINKNAKNSEAIFGIHEETNRVTIKIVDKETKEIIREFPPEETLDMIAKVWELAGLMVDEKR